MGYFKQSELKKVTLKSNPEYWVEISVDLKYGDLKAFSSVSTTGELDFATSADLFLKLVIKSWNLDDENGVVLPITEENINQLNKDDAVAILEEAGGLVETPDEKKNSLGK